MLKYWYILAIARDDHIVAQMPVTDKKLISAFLDRHRSRIISVYMEGGSESMTVHLVPRINEELKKFGERKKDILFINFTSFKNFIMGKINEQDLRDRHEQMRKRKNLK